MAREAVPNGRKQLPLLGAYEDRCAAIFKMLLEDCQEEMFELFRGQCESCSLQKKCFSVWIGKVCNCRSSMSAEEFVECVERFLAIKQATRIQFRYRRVLLCLH